jgi:hypothetical protein
MSRPWRIRIRRADRVDCNHLDNEPCAACEADKARTAALGARPLAAPALQFFGEHVFEHMYDPWEKMPTISSPEVLRQEAEKRGLTSEYLRDSLIHKSGPNRWV